MKTKKGTTLAELCVAIALLAIVVTMTLTFSQLNREHLRQAQNHEEMMTDLTTFEQTVRIWLREYDNADYKVEVSGEKLKMMPQKASLQESAYYFDAETHKLHVGDSTYYTPNILGVEFKFFNRMYNDGRYELLETKRTLVICTVEYDDKNENTDPENPPKMVYTYTVMGQNAKIEQQKDTRR